MSNIVVEPESGGAVIAEPRSGAARWSDFAVRSLNVTIRPNAFWKSFAKRPRLTISEIFFPHMVIMAALGAVASLIGGIAKGRPIGTIALHVSTTFIASLCLVLALAFVARTIVGRGSQFAMRRSLSFAVHGLTPLLVIGFLRVIPSPLIHTIGGLIALPYTFIVLGSGIHSFLETPTERGAKAASVLAAAALLAWSVATILADLPIVSG